MPGGRGGGVGGGGLLTDSGIVLKGTGKTIISSSGKLLTESLQYCLKTGITQRMPHAIHRVTTMNILVLRTTPNALSPHGHHILRDRCAPLLKLWLSPAQVGSHHSFRRRGIPFVVPQMVYG